jgi:alpha-1,3-rhamnosyltransferase
MIPNEKLNFYPLVTVCIPAYNHEKFVSETIRSVLDQTYPNIELIIVNDGSTDNTHGVIKSFQKECENNLSNVIIIDRTNRGLPFTLNEMIKHASGEFIKIIASDDILKKSIIQDSIDFFRENKVDLLFFDLDVINNNSDIIRSHICGIKGLGVDIYNISELSLEKALEYNRFYGPAYILKSEVFKKVGYYNEGISIEDWEFLLRCIKSNLKLGYLQKSLIQYRDHEDNTWKKPLFILENNLKILNQYKEVPNHKSRIKSTIAKAINSIYNNKIYQSKDLKKLKQIFKDENISIVSYLPKGINLILKYGYISLNSK